jgi:hypothetical protein
VQRHRQMQGVTRPQAEGRILEQLGRLAKAAAIERAQFNSTLPVTFRKDVAGRRLFRPPAERVTPPRLSWHLAVH